MQKKPFNKDIIDYVRKNENWVTVWRSDFAFLRIDRLKHTTITRLIRQQVYMPYSTEPEEDVLAYDFNIKTPSECMKFNHAYIMTEPSQAATIQAVNSQWGIVND